MCASSARLNWFCIRTKPRQEPRAQANLQAQGIETLLPLLQTSKPSQFHRCLFPSYIFAKFNAEGFLPKARFTPGVVQVVNVSGKPIEVDQEIIDEVRSRMDALGVVSNPQRFAEGDKVQVMTGTFQDFIGKFNRLLPHGDQAEIILDSNSGQWRVQISRFEIHKVGGQCEA